MISYTIVFKSSARSSLHYYKLVLLFISTAKETSQTELTVLAVVPHISAPAFGRVRAGAEATFTTGKARDTLIQAPAPRMIRPGTHAQVLAPFLTSIAAYSITNCIYIYINERKNVSVVLPISR